MALTHVREGRNNVGVGALAMAEAINPIDCVAIGVEALGKVVDGVGGTAVGRLACATLKSAGNNTGVGDSTLRYLESGVGNVALGYTAAEQVKEGSHNTLLGVASGKLMPSGEYNTAVGAHSMTNAGTSSENVALGAMSMMDASGVGNVAVGLRAGAALREASRSVFVGWMAGGTAEQNASVDNCVVIGNSTAALRSHQVVLGNVDTQEFVLGGVQFNKQELLALLSIIRRGG